MHENYQNTVSRGQILGGTMSGLAVEAGCASNIPAECGYSPNNVHTISATVEVHAVYPFSHALDALKAGCKITRAGWNGRGQHIEMQRPDKLSRMTAPYAVLKNSNNDLVPWVPSQGDLFANDWALLPPEYINPPF